MTWRNTDRRRQAERDDSSPAIRISDERKVVAPIYLILAAASAVFALGTMYARGSARLDDLESQIKAHGTALDAFGTKLDGLKDAVRDVQGGERALSGKMDLLLQFRAPGSGGGTRANAGTREQDSAVDAVSK